MLAVGSPMWDTCVLLQQCSSFLDEQKLKEGDAKPLNFSEFQTLKKASLCYPGYVRHTSGCGGCASNCAKVASRLGVLVSFCGCLGNNDIALRFQTDLMKHGIVDLTNTSSSVQNGEVLCIVDADSAQRTFAYFAGSSSSLTFDKYQEKTGISKKAIKSATAGVSVIYFDAYTLLQSDNFAYLAMEEATKNGVLVGFNTGSCGIVNQMKQDMILLIKAFCSILIVNEEEGNALLDKRDVAMNPEVICRDLSRLMRSRNGIAVVTLGENGCWAANNDQPVFFSTEKVVAKDTTGAGDFFAGGFCAALINELDGQLSTLQPDSIEKSIKIGQEIAAKCVSFLGTNLSEAEW
eukprot:CAMPEP_0184022998 /NCGR_PEP_ID=MMETSP0954-20121128/11032_1 /TAXON_ID=627963 /ORGANISM="Aplanochytrium sp, Strain PBS07" /LENGTH=348 /DNA_ID=CAMNT_0026305665 /DNA_START=523 /DNA_END=1566 /DNA_ORIENTATION=-